MERDNFCACEHACTVWCRHEHSKGACTDRASACRAAETEIELKENTQKRPQSRKQKRAAVVFNACASLFSMKITDKEEIQIARHEVQNTITVLRRHYNVLRQHSKEVSSSIYLCASPKTLHRNGCALPEAEFLDVFGTQVLRVFQFFSLLFMSHLLTDLLEQKWFGTGL